jgi:glycosyltransferase involved in cell wall biosynthesis
MITREARELFVHNISRQTVSVIIPLYNYEAYILETLNSVLAQSYRDLAVIVVDDGSADRSAQLVENWMRANCDSGIGLGLWQHASNAKLAVTRNTGTHLSASDYCFFLDADNMIYPRCIEKHVEALEKRPDAAAAYGLIEVFGGRSGIMSAGVFEREALSHGNFIDAMAMIRRSVLINLGGFQHIDHGWEDYDFWLRLCESGQKAIHIPEILSRYRQHAASMLRTDTNLPDHIRKLHAEMRRRHPWLDLH